LALFFGCKDCDIELQGSVIARANRLRRSIGFLLKKVQGLILSRRTTEIVQAEDSGVWVLNEPPTRYGQERGPKTSAKAVN
jgi:hypothetical protein